MRRLCLLTLCFLTISPDYALADSCKRILVLAENGELISKFLDLGSPVDYELSPELDGSSVEIEESVKGKYFVRINPQEGEKPIYRLLSRGTCSSSYFFTEDEIKKVINGAASGGYNSASALDSLGIDEDSRWDFWGTEERLIRLDGYVYIITGRFQTHPIEINRIDGITRDGRRTGICRVDQKDSINIIQLSSDPSPACVAIMSGNAKEVFFEERVELAAPARVGGFKTSFAQRGKADLNNDGTIESVALLTHSSGAGCGGEFARLVELDHSTNSVATSPMTSFLDDQSLSGLSTSARFHWGTVRVFLHEGIYYMVGRGNDGSGVYLWESDRFQLLCPVELRPDF